MKFIHKISLAAIVASSLNFGAHAQSVVTEPVGFITIPAKGATGGTPATTFIALSMTRPAVYQAIIPAASVVANASVLTFPASTFTPNQFGPSGGSYYLEILNGANAGVTSPITATTANSITLRDDLSNGITAGTTTFRIRPNWTFGTAFGTANETGFQGGAGNSTNADLIQLVDPLTSVATSYFYNTSSSRWEKTDNTNATDIAISPEVGLQVVRKGTGDLNFKLTGAIKTGPSGMYVSGSTSDTYNLLANPYALDSVMLKDTGLYTGSASTGLVGGAAASLADVLRIYDFAHAQYNDFYYNTNDAKWKTGATDASLTTIPAGASLAIIRRANNGSFYWYAPQPSMVLSDIPLPLTLLSAVSRKSHGSFGSADINLPLTGTTGIENRAINGTTTVVFSFSKPILTGTVSINPPGIGTVASTTIVGKELRASLTGISDVQALTFTISGVTDSDNNSLSSSASMRVLSGDADRNGSVNILDLQLIKGYVSQPLSLGSFQADTDVSSAVNILDLQSVKSKVTNRVP